MPTPEYTPTSPGEAAVFPGERLDESDLRDIESITRKRQLEYGRFHEQGPLDEADQQSQIASDREALTEYMDKKSADDRAQKLQRDAAQTAIRKGGVTFTGADRLTPSSK